MRRHLPPYTAVIIDAKIPERPLSETERLAVAMGYIQCQFRVERHWIWVGERQDLRQSNFTRAWAVADKRCEELVQAVPGTLAIQEQVYSDTPFIPVTTNPFTHR